MEKTFETQYTLIVIHLLSALLLLFRIGKQSEVTRALNYSFLKGFTSSKAITAKYSYRQHSHSVPDFYGECC